VNVAFAREKEERRKQKRKMKIRGRKNNRIEAFLSSNIKIGTKKKKIIIL
jgi:hypothetical protein